jgi:DNA replication protein DnaC
MGYPQKVINRHLQDIDLFHGVPQRFHGADLKDFGKFFKWSSKDSLFLFGNRGAGKTHLMAAMVNDLIQQGELKTYMVSAPRLLIDIRDNMIHGEVNEAQMIQRLNKREFLFLDDLGTEKPTEWVLQTLYMLVDSRYISNMSIVVSSNYSLKDISAKLDDRIASRIAEMCKLVQLKFDDRRVDRR